MRVGVASKVGSPITREGGWAMKRILIAAVLPLLAAAAPVKQAPAIISGKIVDASGAPLPVALVRIDALSVGTTSRADGQYRLVIPVTRLLPDTRDYVVRASHRGFAPATQSVTVAPGETSQAEFQLQPAPAQR
jgi:carboxypeptidase family protein